MFRLPTQLGVWDRKVVGVLQRHGNLEQGVDVWIDGKEYLRICDYSCCKECGGKLLSDVIK